MLQLCQELRALGIDAWIDQFDEIPPPRSWAMWMLDQIERADLVIAVCTTTYRRRVEGRESGGRGLGSRWEGAILTQQLYEESLSAEPARIIPVLLAGESTDAIPIQLRGTTHYRLDGGPDGLSPLVAHLTGDARVIPAPLGPPSGGRPPSGHSTGGSAADVGVPLEVPSVDTFGLRDVLGQEALDVDAIRSRWTKPKNNRWLLLGMAPSGPVYWDPVTEGPHLLVAGTTGSGKTELLRACIAHLALSYSPTEWNVLFIDYKGGASFAPLFDLPHSIGLITDLEDHNAARVQSMLSAEIQRRERLLQAYAAASIDHLPAQVAPELPRLLIVLDEFATLAHENPAFLQVLEHVGRVGRSLGIHIVYGTQRPTVVSEGLLANIATRIALRLVDAGDSVSVIGTAIAQSIPYDAPGTALMVTRGQDVQGFRAPHMSWDDDANTTSANSVLKAVQAATESFPVPKVSRWPTDGLPQTYLLGKMPHRDGERSLGVIDRPEQFGTDLWSTEGGRVGSLEVIGTAGSGKSTALMSIATSACTLHPTDALALHVLDFGPDRAVTPLASLPHTRTQIDGSSPLEALAFIGELARIATGRDPSTSAFEDLRDVRYHLVMVDDAQRWFDATYEAAQAVSQLLSVGPERGVEVVFSTDLPGSLAGRVGPIGRRLVLRLSDPSDYLRLGLPADALPRHAPPGRGVLVPGVLPVQVATLAAGDKRAQTDALRELAHVLRAASA